jgi:hypothetical protein
MGTAHRSEASLLYIRDVLLLDLAVHRVRMQYLKLLCPPPKLSLYIYCIYSTVLWCPTHIISFRKINHCGAELHRLVLCPRH